MKTYTRVVIDMVTWKTLEEDWYHHDGPVALCKGPTPPKIPPPPTPPPIPEPPDLELTEERKRQEFLDQMLYRMQRGRRSTLTASRAGTLGGSTIMTERELAKRPGATPGMVGVSPSVLGR